MTIEAAVAEGLAGYGRPTILMQTADNVLREEAALWSEASARAESGRRVLIATTMGGFNQGAMTEKALAMALTLRGAKVDIFLCDGAPGCQITKISKEPPLKMMAADIRVRCPSCIKAGRATYEPLGCRIHKQSELLTDEDRQEAASIAGSASASALKELRLDGWKIGEHALAGALRYYAIDDLSAEEYGEGLARVFVKAAVLTARAFDRLVTTNRYDVIVANHGIYVPQGILGEVARSRGVRIVNWNPAYRRQCFIFSHGDSYHHTMITEDTKQWENLQLTTERRERITSYLRDRRQAKGDWIWFNSSADSSAGEISQTLNLDDRPIIVALTSVVWDACLHYESNAFESLSDWALQTIEYFAGRPDLQLVMRIHPAEVRGFVKSRAKMADIIARRFPVLPENVRIVPPEDSLSTYSLMDAGNAVLLYSTKTGIEASAQGIPVIVAGEAWIRNKGFSKDVTSPSDYRHALDQLPYPERLDPARRERALRYAYHFFFRRMIELPFLQEVATTTFDVQLDHLSDMAPGKQGGLDAIVDGILHGTPFVHDALVDEVEEEVTPAATPIREEGFARGLLRPIRATIQNFGLLK